MSALPHRLVVIPVFNEERHVAEILCELAKWHTDEVLVVNDGSTDRTAEILGQRCCKSLNVITHGTNKGYGAALIAGFRFAIEGGFAEVVTMDADWQHQPCAVPRFFEELKNSDIVSGSRYLEEFGGNDAAPSSRREINKQITARINSISGFNLTDGFCGFKALRVEALKRLHLDEPGYAFPLQFWIQASAAKLSIKELAVKRIYNDPSRSFGESLDNPDVRLAHYNAVIDKESKRWLAK
jgi:glycosyltransferase involved in cell wall biosynthesis